MVDSKSPSSDTHSNKNKLRPKWSTVWVHCTDLKNGKAVCNICGAGLAYHSHISTSTYNLKRHLRLKHPTLGLSRKKRSFGAKYNNGPRTDMHRRSTVWDHCTIISDRRVKCDLCSTELVYINASTHNLKRHLQTKHTPEELHNNSKPITDRAEETEKSNANSSRKQNKIIYSSAVDVALAGENTLTAAPTTATTTTTTTGSVSDDDSELEFVKQKPALSGTRQRLYDEALLEMIALDFQPTSIIDDVGFRDFVSQLQPLYLLPRQRTLRDKMIPLRFDRLMNRRRIEMQDATAVCLTIEGWTSTSDHQYFAVTGHYLGLELETKTWLLDCIEYRGQQDTITYLKDELVRVSEDWQIQDKVVAVVTDNISEILTAVELIGWTRLPCFTHTLNAIANAVLSEIDEILIKIRTVVEHFRCSTTASTMLRSVMQHMNLVEMDLVQDITPHWTSTYHMLHRFNELRDAIINTLSLLNEPCLQLLSWPDWDVIGRSCDLMMALYEAAIEISSEKFMSASKAVVMIRGLLRLCRDHIAAPGQLPTIEKMASVMMSSISNWFGNMELNPLLAEAMLLDPRFKRSGFTESTAAELAIRNVTEAASRDLTPAAAVTDKSDNEILVPTDSDKAPTAKTTMQLLSVWDDYDQHVSDMLGVGYPVVNSTSTQDKTTELVTSSSSVDLKQCSVWSDYDEKVSSSLSVDNTTADAVKQFNRFLQEPPLPRQENCLEWWRQRMLIYPRLLPVVRERLCIVATSVSSENIFTTTGLALNERRKALRPCEVRSRVFLNANLCP